MQNSDSKNILLSIIGIALLLVSVVGITYAIIVFGKKGIVKNTISTGSITMLYNESDNVISINDALPMSDSVGKIQNEYFDFSIAANIKGNVSIDYEIRARRTDSGDNRLPNNAVNIYLEKMDNGRYLQVMEPKVFAKTENTTLNDVYINNDSMLLYKGMIVSNKEISAEDKFRLRIWLKENSEMYTDTKIYKLKVDVYSSLSKK